MIAEHDGVSPGESYSTIKAVERALEIIEILADSRAGRTGADIAHALRLNRAIAYRLLASLTSAGFISQHEPGPHYRLTFKLIALANLFTEALEIGDLFVPLLRRLADQTGEVVQLVLREGDHLVRVAKAGGNERLRVAFPIGSRPVLHASASGRAWLSTMSDEQALALVYQQLAQEIGMIGVRSLDELREALASARASGFAISFEESAQGVCSVAAPLVVRRRGHEPDAVGAVTVAAPTARVDRTRLLEFGPLVVATAANIVQAWPQEWP